MRSATDFFLAIFVCCSVTAGPKFIVIYCSATSVDVEEHLYRLATNMGITVITSSQVSISEDRGKVSVAIGVSVVCLSLCIRDCKPACQFRVLLKHVFFLLFTEACSYTLPFR
jgi:hypothetical protein